MSETPLGSQIAVVDGQLVARGTTPAEIRIAIKELRLLKKEAQANKREVAAELRVVRADRRAQVAHRTPLIRGGGGFGQILRAGVQVKRAVDRGGHDDRVREFEERIAAIDRNILGIDKVIAQCEVALLRATS